MNSTNDNSPFEQIDVKGDPGGILRIRYGSSRDDPMPFVLTVTPPFVARALRKTLPIMLQDIQEYARRNSDELRTIAQKAKNQGRDAEVLE
jgi:hypothetical protein